ncbi:low molecular weight protein-tyrosine-phosphatase [Neotabrizicola shimadae]|uniref:protein-tyrosine-phosphatase n=1 Tax=Neotabrizicola shimadae TaxID=2807096 RepID=A0A8G0ZQW8_9RHOB|nr:low molecular weight protein-tyrosine-phosphatase [Neotabrizicola shimadae]QYZ68448.1 low molecular weight phosphotyrosine protein phosphatase [Neotabrizicola shimadae]
MTAVLFVCLGNICRSPTAEGVFRAMAARAGLSVTVDSAGTGGWHAGEPPHPPSVAAALRRGYDLRQQRARQVRPEDFTRFDLIYAMDRRNLQDLTDLRKGQGTRPALFLDLVPQLGLRDMPDPWYTGEFDRVLDLVEAASQALVRRLSAT